MVLPFGGLEVTSGEFGGGDPDGDMTSLLSNVAQESIFYTVTLNRGVMVVKLVFGALFPHL